MQALSIHAGPRALQALREHGLQPQHVRENIHTQRTRHANSCFFTMVVMDEQRKAVAVPPLVLVTENQRRRDAAARMRRELRQEVAQRMKKARFAR